MVPSRVVEHSSAGKGEVGLDWSPGRHSRDPAYGQALLIVAYDHFLTMNQRDQGGDLLFSCGFD
jgi:hypothetical protein